jgi:hypothetical protein
MMNHLTIFIGLLLAFTGFFLLFWRQLGYVGIAICVMLAVALPLSLVTLLYGIFSHHW